jgi:hypothetical protein
MCIRTFLEWELYFQVEFEGGWWLCSGWALVERNLVKFVVGCVLASI